MRLVAVLLGAATALATIHATAQVPAGYPPSYAETIPPAQKEGKLFVHPTTPNHHHQRPRIGLLTTTIMKTPAIGPV